MKTNQKDYGFNVEFLKRFLNILRILFPGFCSITFALFLALLFLSFLEEYVIYHVGLIPSRFYKVLGEKNLDDFKSVAFISVGIVIAQTIIKSTKTYMSNVLSISWRQLLCRALHGLYFSDINFYHLNLEPGTIDNPDQRMTQDVDKLCSTTGEIFAKVIIAPFVIGYYSYRAYSNAGWVGPSGVFLLFLISTVVNKLLMTPIVKKVFEQEKWEGDFRFKHMQIRVNSESLAFHGSSILEAGKTNQKLDALLRTQQQKFNRQYLLSLAVNFFDYIGSIASYLILSVPIFAGSYDHMNHADLAALISQNAFVCIYLIFSFSSLVDLSPKVVDIAGMTHRVAELVEELNHLKEHNPPSWRDGPSWPLLQSQASTSGASAPSVYDIVQLSVTAPSRSQLLIKDLDLTIKLRSNILIMGPSSCGKTSLLRTLRGLWTQNSGSLKCNLPVTPRHILFMPQRPFFTDGSLLDQVVYPLQDRGMGVQSYDESVMESLELVDLLPLVDRVGGLRTPVSWNWYEVLTPGEMQRLCFVRLFYHRPQLGLLDEVTSAISEDLEAVLFRRCRELGITLVTVGHRRSLRAHHDLILALDGRGGWTLESLRS